MQIEQFAFEGETFDILFYACQGSQIRAPGHGGQKGDCKVVGSFSASGYGLAPTRLIQFGRLQQQHLRCEAVTPGDGGGDTFGQRRGILFRASKTALPL